MLSMCDDELLTDASEETLDVAERDTLAGRADVGAPLVLPAVAAFVASWCPALFVVAAVAAGSGSGGVVVAVP